MNEPETNHAPSGDLRKKADALLDAAFAYWNTYRASGLAGAVVWVKDRSGCMVILTRGEYREQLMWNIDQLVREENVRMFDE